MDFIIVVIVSKGGNIVMSDGKVLLFNHEKCAGCRSCVVGCSLYHDGECGKVVSRVAVVRNERFGESFP